MTARLVSSVLPTPGAHDPVRLGMVLIRGNIYIGPGGTYYVRQAEVHIPAYHRTGKPAWEVQYVGLNDVFGLTELDIICAHMEQKAHICSS